MIFGDVAFNFSPGQSDKDFVVCHSPYALQDVLNIGRYGSLAATGAHRLALCRLYILLTVVDVAWMTRQGVGFASDVNPATC
jgi:hypothetical protein